MIGIYFLLLKKKVVYIGKTKHFPRRVAGHCDKLFDQIRFIKCDQSKLNHYESRLIALFKPCLNINLNPDRRVMGKHKYIVFRMPRNLYMKMKKRADKNERSVNNEIVETLKSIFEPELV